MDGLKETAARVVAWAKEHPYIAALILGGIVLLAWLTIRNRGDGGGGGDGNFSSEYPPSDGLEAGTGSGSSIGGFGDLAGLPVSDSNIAPAPLPVISGGGGGGGGFDSFDFPPVDYGSPVDFGLGSYAAGDPVLSLAADDLAGVNRGGKTASTSTGTVGSRTPQTNAAPRRSSAMPASYSQLATQSPAKTSGQVKTKTSKRKRSDASPAYLAGKGQNFTGYYNGINYVNGYPTTGNAAFSSVVKQAPPTLPQGTVSSNQTSLPYWYLATQRPS